MRATRQYYVYIMTNATRTLYIGVTNDLLRRVYEHKNKLIDGFTKKYNLTRLAYFEETPDVSAAIAREKELKAWRRSKKVALIESMNPRWMDLALDWYDSENRSALDSSSKTPRNDNKGNPQNDKKRVMPH